MKKEPIKVILTGATGMVGEGVLHECLLHEEVEKVLVIGRKSCGVTHPKLTEIIHPDLSDLSTFEEGLKGYNACFFCAGISSLGVKDDEYYRLTYTLTIKFAEPVCRLNPGMVFCYVSGSGTDGTEKGRMKWARVKGKTENDLMKMPFKAAYGFRPGFMMPTPGLKNVLSFYKYITWLFPLLSPLFPGTFGTLKELSLAMINIVNSGYDKKVLEVKDIRIVSLKS